MTNMDVLTIPAVGGIDSTALIVGDFSNGNDGIVMKNGKTVKDLKGRSVKLVEFTVSHYMLARALEMNGMTETRHQDGQHQRRRHRRRVRRPTRTAPPSPGTRRCSRRATPRARRWCSTRPRFPGEIIDLMVVRTNAPDSLKKALTGAWYETMAVMTGNDKAADDALAFMAKSSGATVPEFKAQLGTTAMFYKAADAVAFTTGPAAQEDDGVRAHLQLRQGALRPAREEQGLRRHRVPRRLGRRRPEERQAALHRATT